MAGFEAVSGVGALLRSPEAIDPQQRSAGQAMSEINQTLNRLGVEGVGGPAAVDRGERASFESMLTDLVGQVDKAQKHSAEEARKLMTGESDSIHQTVVAMQESGVAMTLLVETRNKLVESYKEIMRMQV
jgi:flagellar hook-basal body complex protein FliE